MQTPSDPSIPFDLDKLYQEARPELETVGPSEFANRHVVRTRVVELTDILVGSWGPIADELGELFVPLVAEQRKRELGRLHERAWVFYAADLAAEEPRADTSRIRRRELAKTVAAHDRYLFKWATPVFADHPIHGETLRDISRGVGLRDDAEDVLRLVALFREHWDEVADQVPAVTEKLLDQAANDASTQLGLLRNGSNNPLRRLAHAAYTLWHRDYVELMWLGRYLCRGESDALERFPGVRTPGVRRVDEVGEDEDVEDEADAADEVDAVEEAVEGEIEDPNAAA